MSCARLHLHFAGASAATGLSATPVVGYKTDVPGAEKMNRDEGELGFLQLGYESKRA